MELLIREGSLLGMVVVNVAFPVTWNIHGLRLLRVCGNSGNVEFVCTPVWACCLVSSHNSFQYPAVVLLLHRRTVKRSQR
jgi:hypothetical protein